MLKQLFLAPVLASLLLICALPAAAQTIPVTEDNIHSFLYIGGSLRLACYTDEALLGSLSKRKLLVGARFRAFGPAAKLRVLKGKIKRIKTALRQSVVPALRRKALSNQVIRLRQKVRKLTAASATCRQFNGGNSSGSSSSSPPDSPGSCTQISQYGITWLFDKGYPCGQFVNGDWWALGPLTITRISPDAHDGINGWTVNQAYENKESLDQRFWDGYYYDASLMPSLPHTTSGVESIIKVVSTPTCPRNQCISDAAILTVVNQIPERDAFRPPFSGSYKPFFYTRDLQTQLLPKLGLTSHAISQADALARSPRMPRLDFTSSSVVSFIPNNSVYPESRTWGAEMAVSNAELIYWLSMDLPLADKMPSLIDMVQYGIDLYGSRKTLKTTWIHGGGGNGAGRLVPFMFAAIMLNSNEMKQELADSREAFWERYMFNRSTKTGEVYWGGRLEGWDTEDSFWKARAIDTDEDRAGKDWYEYIDGGAHMGGQYLGCVALPTKYSALVIHLFPAMKLIWPVRDITILEFADRWVTQGVHTQPDLCAPPMGFCIGGSNAGEVCTYANLNACPSGVCAAGACEDGPYAGQPCVVDRSRTDGDATGAAGPSPQNDCGGSECTMNPQFYKATYGPDPANPGECINDSDGSDGIGRYPELDGLYVDSQNEIAPRRSTFGDEMWVAYRALDPD